MATSNPNSEKRPLWVPPHPEETPMYKYRQHVEKKFGIALKDTKELHRWSVTHPQEFHCDLYNYLGLIPALPPSFTKAYDDTVQMSNNPVFFKGHRLNYAENALSADPDPDAVAIIGLREGDDLTKTDGERITRQQLRELVKTTSSALKRSGIQEGDRVGALVSTSISACVLFLASASIGAIFTCISPDLGAEGCVSRLQQVTPKILFCDGDMTYKGRRSSIIDKIDTITSHLKQKPHVFVINVALHQDRYPTFDDFLQHAKKDDELEFNRVPFNQPLIICYSSGTTGAPKCIVHGHGLILNLRKVSRLQNSLRSGEIVMQYTSTSWVMFYISQGHLASGATVVCYDGSPMFPDVRQMMRIVEKFKVTYFGTSPRYLAELEMNKVIPKDEFDLRYLRMINTTGAPLATDQYVWFYDNFPSKVHLNNSAGGTDSATTFIGADPCGSLIAEMQTINLGIDADVADPITGESIMASGEAGELVIRKPFPSMPVFFWGDQANRIYRAAYFERFENVDCWAQHDWVSRNPHTLGWTMSGRSDGVLNPSGIRFGSGEIYAIAEGPSFNDEIAETLCVGRRRPSDRDETVFLFVKMNKGKLFTEDLKERLKRSIAQGLSPRHVPRFMTEVEELPVTINGKKVEIAVKQIISGKKVTPSSTVANPGAFKQFEKFVGLEEEKRQSKL